jgi:transcriptional regulator with GAF, ATPase, and Fis domain
LLEKDLNLFPLYEFDKMFIIKVLEKTFWRVDGPKGATQIFEMHPETLRSRMRKLEITRP